MKLIYSHKGRFSQGMCFKESFCHLLCKHPGLRVRTQVSFSAGEELPTSWYSSTGNDSLVKLPANFSTAVNQARDTIVPTMIHLNYKGNTGQYLNHIK